MIYCNHTSVYVVAYTFHAFKVQIFGKLAKVANLVKSCGIIQFQFTEIVSDLSL